MATDRAYSLAQSPFEKLLIGQIDVPCHKASR